MSETLNLLEQQYIHDMMLDALMQSSSPEDVTPDLTSDEVNGAYAKLIRMEFPEDHIRLLSAAALLHLQDFYKDLNALIKGEIPEYFQPEPEPEIPSHVKIYQDFHDIFAWHIMPDDDLIHPNKIFLNKDLDAQLHELEEIGIDRKFITVAAARAHIDLKTAMLREFDDTSNHGGY